MIRLERKWHFSLPSLHRPCLEMTSMCLHGSTKSTTRCLPQIPWATRSSQDLPLQCKVRLNQLTYPEQCWTVNKYIIKLCVCENGSSLKQLPWKMDKNLTEWQDSCICKFLLGIPQSNEWSLKVKKANPMQFDFL